MTRRLLNLLTSLSLLLCVAVVALWVRSYRVQDTFTWEDNNIYVEAPPDTEVPDDGGVIPTEAPPVAPSEAELLTAMPGFMGEDGPIWFDTRQVVVASGGVQLRRWRAELGGFAGAAGRPGFSYESEAFDPADPRSLAYPVSATAFRDRWLDWSAAGFEAVSAESGTRSTAVEAGTGEWVSDWSVTTPLWAVALVCAIRPAWCAAAWYRSARRRRRPGCCTNCGYDLTGNVSGVCPECGSAP